MPYSRRFAILIHLRGLTKQIGLALWVFALEVLPGDLTNCQSQYTYIYMSDMMYINVYPMISMIDLHKMVEVHPLYMASSLLDLDVLGGLGHLDPRVSPMRHDLPGLVMTNF